MRASAPARKSGGPKSPCSRPKPKGQRRPAARLPGKDPSPARTQPAKDPSPGGERRALDDRKTALMAGSLAPGSALSCLDELAGEAVEAACEKGVFASPEAVAAAVKYVAAQLALLDDGTAYAKRSDASYATELAPLRTAVELDRFGLVAQVLKEREGCTVDRCDALTRFRDSTRVLANLRDRTFEFDDREKAQEILRRKGYSKKTAGQ